jgi:S1-C subfamily serine protease
MTSCPPTDRLEALLDECLHAPEQQDLEAHIADCASCQAALETLTEPPESLRKLIGNMCDLAALQRENGVGASGSFFRLLKRVAAMGPGGARGGTSAQPPVIQGDEMLGCGGKKNQRDRVDFTSSVTPARSGPAAQGLQRGLFSMRMHLRLSLCALLALPLAAQSAAPPARPGAPADSVVRVTASIRYPNPVRPWARSKAVEVAGTGVVIGGNKILTNAHLVQYATEVHVQANPGADKIEARVESIGPDVDLAVLRVSDKTFFDKRRPLRRARNVPKARDGVEVYGFPVGGAELSVTKGVVSRISYGRYYGSSVGLILQVSAAINEGNSGGPAVVGGRMVGVVFSRLEEAQNIGYVIPNEEIDLFLEDVKDGRYDGKPSDATWTQYQRLENPSLRKMLKLDRKARGILARLPRQRGKDYPFHEFDVLTLTERQTWQKLWADADALLKRAADKK